MKNLIEINGLTKEYKDSTGYTNLLFRGLDFAVEEKKITTLLAPVGSGKSSMLKVIAGLEPQTAGEINSNFKCSIYIPTDSSIFPWLDVNSNIKYNLPNVSETELQDALQFTGLDGYEDHIPNPKSKGFQLRTALARAIVRKPDLIILDEPFDIIKPSVRQLLVELVIRINRELGIAILMTSTNISRAILVSDKLIVMRKNPGEIIGEFEIGLDADRTLALYESAEFKSIKSNVEETIKSVRDLNEYEFTL